jgi:ABC-type transport system substrate-binding protein
MSRLLNRRAFMLLGFLALVALTVACAKSATPVAAPAPKAPGPAAPAAAPAPTAAPAAAPSPAAPSTAAPTASPAPSQAERSAELPVTALDRFLAYPDGQPLVPGGPPFYSKQLAKEKGIQILFQYHVSKLPLWQRASYGGDFRGPTVLTPASNFQFLRTQVLSRPTYSGMLLHFDSGRCSLVGRDSDFSRCKGEYGHSQSLVIVPGIVQKWEQPSSTEYTFHVRKGVLWPAGQLMKRTDREVTAADIVWFLGVQKDDSSSALRDNFQLVDKFEATDRYTVKVTLRSPVAEFMRHMANSSMGMFPKECYEEKGCLGSTAAQLHSPGPFLVKDLVIRERHILEKNPEFHLPGMPYVDRIVGTQIADPAAQKAAFVTGQIDQHTFWTDAEVDAMKRQVPGMQVHTQAVLAGTTVLRSQHKGPLADVRVRRALAMAMDHHSIWEGASGGFGFFPNIVSRDYFGADWYYAPSQVGEWYQFNPQRAKQLLTEAGYGNGFKLQVSMTGTAGQQRDQVTIIQANWKKHLNVDVNIVTVDTVAWNAGLYQKTWQDLTYMYGWNVSYWAEGDAAVGHFVYGNKLNFQSVNDPFMTEIYPKVRGELDPAKRAALLWQVEQRELDQVYMFRIQPPTSFNIQQPWEMNGASHQVAWWGPTNGTGWLGMQDLTKAPKR